ITLLRVVQQVLRRNRKRIPAIQTKLRLHRPKNPWKRKTSLKQHLTLNILSVDAAFDACACRDKIPHFGFLKHHEGKRRTRVEDFENSYPPSVQKHRSLNGFFS